MTSQETLISKKRRGPAPSGQGVPILVRVQPDRLAAIDRWMDGKVGVSSRPEAIRRLVELGLKAAD